MMTRRGVQTSRHSSLKPLETCRYAPAARFSSPPWATGATVTRTSSFVRKRPAPQSFQSRPSRLSMVATFASSNVPVAAQRAAKITGLYIGVIGIALFVAPVTCFSILFDPTEIKPIWIRVFGSLCALLGWYYRGASQDSILECW